MEATEWVKKRKRQGFTVYQMQEYAELYKENGLSINAYIYGMYNRHNVYTPHLVLAIVGKYHGVRAEDIIKKTRLKEIVATRYITMAFCRVLFSYSVTELGDMFGGLDHATVSHATKWVKNIIELGKIDSRFLILKQIAEEIENMFLLPRGELLNRVEVIGIKKNEKM